MRFGGVGMAVDARAHFGEVVEVVCRARHQCIARLRDHLSGITALGFRQLGYVLADQLGKIVQQRRTLFCRPSGPGRERRFGRTGEQVAPVS